MENNKTVFKKGEIIFRQGDLDFSLFEILSGSVYIYVDYGKESEQMLTEMKSGQTFGEMSILGYRPRSATVVAASDAEVICVKDEDFEEYMIKNPQRVLQMMKQLSDRTRELTLDYNEALYTVAQIRDQQQKDSGLMARIAKFAKIWRTSGKK